MAQGGVLGLASPEGCRAEKSIAQRMALSERYVVLHKGFLPYIPFPRKLAKGRPDRFQVS